MVLYFFFNDTATTEIYTLSLHDALPIYVALYLLVTMAPFAVVAPVIGPLLDRLQRGRRVALGAASLGRAVLALVDRKSTRLNSSHANISYAVFCLQKQSRSSACARQAGR